MVNEIFDFFRKEVNFYIKAKSSEDNLPDVVDFPLLDTDSLKLKEGAVNLLLVNMEEDKILRQADPFVRLDNSGVKSSVSPPLRLNLSLMFAAKFSDYLNALKHLSQVIQFFQKNKVFTNSKFPSLPRRFEKIIVELESLTHAQKNEVWGSLRMVYLPSVVYKVKLVVFQDDMISLESEIEEIQKGLIHHEI